MRILRAIRSVNPEGGGPIEGITQVSRMLARMGHEVDLVSLDTPKDVWVQNCPLKVHAVGRGGRLQKGSRAGSQLRACPPDAWRSAGHDWPT